MEEAEDEFDESSDEEVDDESGGFHASTRRNWNKLGKVSPRSKNSLRDRSTFQQPSALLNSSNDYVNFERLETPSVL